MSDLTRRQLCAALGSSLALPALAETSAPWAPAFGELGEGHPFTELEVEGSLPEGLRGTLYRCGPMRFRSADGRPYDHWFDGDGGVLALRLDGAGRAQGACRLLQTPGLLREQSKQQRLHVSYGSTVDRPLRRLLRGQFKNLANTNIISFGDQLLALVESSPPTRIDPDSLHRLGEEDFQGSLRGGFCAHPHQLPGDPQLYSVGMIPGARPRLRVCSQQPGRPLQLLHEERDPHSPLVHDFALTPRHLILLLPPLRMDMGQWLERGGAFSEGLVWEPERGTQVLLVSRDGSEPVQRFTIDPFYQWHFSNAAQRGDQLQLELVAYPDFTNNRSIGRVASGLPSEDPSSGVLTRVTLDPRRGSARRETLGQRSGEFPQINPRFAGQSQRWIYLAEHSSEEVAQQGLADTLVRYDSEQGDRLVLPLPEGCYPGEPLIVPRGAREDEAWLLSQVYDSRRERSGVMTYDLAQPQAEPQAAAWFDGPRHMTFHGHFRSA